jgi:hypothetical protein
MTNVDENYKKLLADYKHTHRKTVSIIIRLSNQQAARDKRIIHDLRWQLKRAIVVYLVSVCVVTLLFLTYVRIMDQAYLQSH